MKFLNSKRVLENGKLLCSYFLNDSPVDPFYSKSKFITVLNKIQRTSFADNPTVTLEFNNKETTEFLLKNEVFSQNELACNFHIIPDRERLAIVNLVNEALEVIKKSNYSLYEMINAVVGSIGIYNIPERDGGSISNGIGLIWLSPHQNWDAEYCGEMIVHEFIHNCVFLEDMVRGVMPNTELLEDKDAFTTSAIRQTKRPYDKAFHSACVVTGIMYYYNFIGNYNKSLEFVPSLRTTLADLKFSYQKMEQNGKFVLSKNGFEILNEMETFANNLDYLVFEKAMMLS